MKDFDFTQVHMRMRPDQVRAFDMNEAIRKGKDCTVGFMHDLGITFDEADEGVAEMTKIAQGVFANDANEAQTGSTISAGVEFLRHFLPKTITVATEKRVVDDLLGRTIAGDWSDAEVVQSIMELVSNIGEYSDNGDFPLANFKPSYERRTIVRLESGLMTGKLEEMRVAAAKLRTSAYDAKRAALALGFAQTHNEIGFSGYANGDARTYGILNDTNLFAYEPVANNGATTPSTLWADKTFEQIVKDLNTAAKKLRQQSGSNFDANTSKFTLGIASDCMDYLNTLNSLGNKSVAQWIADTWKGCRIVSVPQYSAANGGLNVFYMIMDSLGGSPVVDQYVQATMRLLGTEKKPKGLLEDYTSATAGVLVSQPCGITRWYGI